MRVPAKMLASLDLPSSFGGEAVKSREAGHSGSQRRSDPFAPDRLTLRWNRGNPGQLGGPQGSAVLLERVETPTLSAGASVDHFG